MKELRLTLDCNEIGFKGIERSTNVFHSTVINWVKEASSRILEENYEIPKIAQLEELQTFVSKKNKVWLWSGRIRVLVC